MKKNEKVSLSGKSLLFNIIFILINLAGLSFLVMGYHPTFEENATLFQILGYGFMGLSLVFLYIFEGWFLFSYIARILVGGLFIVSGLIKANDAKGFAYKLEEYFEDGALAYRIKDLLHWDVFSLEYFIEYALIIAIIIAFVEVILGVFLLLGLKAKPVSWITGLIMLFFLFLTWHTKECDPMGTFVDVDNYALDSSIAQSKIKAAEFNDNITILEKTNTTVKVQQIKTVQCVTDCGCFGDAMKGSLGRSLTPAESYWKDIVLLYLTLLIFISRRNITLNNLMENIVMTSAGILVISFFAYVFDWYFPIVFGLILILSSLWMKRSGGKLLGNQFGMCLTPSLLVILFIGYTTMYLPVRDYRPYAVGNDIKTQLEYLEDGIMEMEDGSAIPTSLFQFDPSVRISNLTATDKTFPAIAAALEKNQMTYLSLIDTTSQKEEFQLLDDFDIEQLADSTIIGDTVVQLNEELTEINLTTEILEAEQIILLFSHIIEEGNFKKIDRLKEIAEEAKKHAIPMLMITASSADEIVSFQEKTGLYLPTLQNDGLEIKTITRSNPSLMIMKNGVIKGKYAHRATPSWKWLKENNLNFKENE